MHLHSMAFILVNGSTTALFRTKLRFWQSDPHSFFSSFIMAVTTLHLLLTRAKQLNYLHGITLKGLGLTISQLHFADDTIIFVEPRVSAMMNIKRLLCCVELISRLKIYFGKSCVYLVGVDQTVCNDMANILSCRVGACFSLILACRWELI
ncbi:Uncharacterized protein TCM_012757 [Theobroma cacao]|uniref:Reverse transcriptase domain-containing protein n=1 Tax=Theobroma cacao TaxID=3641 RepID=A0A061G2Q0_THECC|nr:Uncharacterized protein TCM_012757 [Theobroma cacao]